MRWASAENGDAPDHRVMDRSRDMALLEEIGGEQDHRDEHQGDGEVPRPGRRRIERGRREARLGESPDDQHEADRRQERIDPLPGAFAEPRDRFLASALGKDAGRMKPEKDDEAEHEHRHRKSAFRRETTVPFGKVTHPAAPKATARPTLAPCPKARAWTMGPRSFRGSPRCPGPPPNTSSSRRSAPGRFGTSSREFRSRMFQAPSTLAAVRATRPSVLRERYPGALIVGVDSSSDMIDAARKRLPGIAFEVADIRQWRPDAHARRDPRQRGAAMGSRPRDAHAGADRNGLAPAARSPSRFPTISTNRRTA